MHGMRVSVLILLEDLTIQQRSNPEMCSRRYTNDYYLFSAPTFLWPLSFSGHYLSLATTFLWLCLLPEHDLAW